MLRGVGYSFGLRPNDNRFDFTVGLCVNLGALVWVGFMNLDPRPTLLCRLLLRGSDANKRFLTFFTPVSFF